ncbi:MAG TPA: glycosyltransferase [Actinoplanes sp.]|nr:glycosyltransferase [Actinoplanes sp.]
MRTPDVTVVVAVYNTMPYLTACLDSLVAQTIGHNRMQVIAVDDGSTDDSGAELDRYAASYPGLFTVLHQENSGSPAAPSNRALDLATGRYVFFLGSDDYLGTEALQRLVDGADETESDIMLGRLVGVNGRNVFQGIFARDRTDIDLLNSALPWAMSNTKLFRRSLLEEHGIRFPQDLRTGSDQPFTLRAVLASRRISVLTGYKFYYAVRRTDASNITYSTTPEDFVSTTARLMDHAAGLIPPGEVRDAVLRRHFTWELGKHLRAGFLDYDRGTQLRVQDGIRKLAEAYLTDNLRRRLDVKDRIPLSVAQYGELDDLIAVVRHQAQQGLMPLAADGDRVYAALPGFREPRLGFADDWFDVTGSVAKSVFRLEAVNAHWDTFGDGAAALTFGVRSAVADLPLLSDPALQVRWGDVAGTVVDATPDGTGTMLRFSFHPADLMAHAVAKMTRPVTAVVSTCGSSDEVAVRGKQLAGARRRILRRGLRVFVVTPTLDRHGRLMVAVTPVTPRRVLGRLRRALR